MLLKNKMCQKMVVMDLMTGWNEQHSLRNICVCKHYFVLKSMGFITDYEEKQAYRDIKTLSRLPYATICCPLMVEVIAQKT